MSDKKEKRKLKQFLKLNDLMFDNMQKSKLSNDDMKYLHKFHKYIKKHLKSKINSLSNEFDTLMPTSLLPALNNRNVPTLTTLGMAGNDIFNAAQPIRETRLTTGLLGTPTMSSNLLPMMNMKPNYLGVSSLGANVPQSVYQLGSVGFSMNRAMRPENINVEVPANVADSVNKLNSMNKPAVVDNLVDLKNMRI